MYENRLRHRQRAVRLLAELHQRLAVDRLHDDEAFGPLAHEVVDADDVRVLHGGEVLALLDGDLQHARVLRVEEPLQDDPAVQHSVEREVDPPEPSERDRPLHLVLPGDDVPLLEGGHERVLLPALLAEAGLARQLRVARRAEALAIGDDRRDEGRERVHRRERRASQGPAAHHARGRAPGPDGSGARRTRRLRAA